MFRMFSDVTQVNFLDVTKYLVFKVTPNLSGVCWQDDVKWIPEGLDQLDDVSLWPAAFREACDQHLTVLFKESTPTLDGVDSSFPLQPVVAI